MPPHVNQERYVGSHGGSLHNRKKVKHGNRCTLRNWMNRWLCPHTGMRRYCFFFKWVKKKWLRLVSNYKVKCHRQFRDVSLIDLVGAHVEFPRRKTKHLNLIENNQTFGQAWTDLGNISMIQALKTSWKSCVCFNPLLFKTGVLNLGTTDIQTR